MKILVYGLGALGTVYGCLLKGQGHRVDGLDRPEVAEVIAERGVKVIGIWGDHQTHLDQVFNNVEQLMGQDYDLVILSVKSYDTELVAQQMAPIIKPSTYVMLAQNGFGNFEAAVKFIPGSQLIVGRVIFGAETLSLGESKVTVIADDVIIGSPANVIEMDVLDQFSRICSEAGVPTRTSSEVMQYLWGKIIYNSALNPLGAILEVAYGELANNDNTRGLMDGIIEEIFAVLKAHGQATLWPNAKSYRKAFYEQMVPTTALHHASMLQDIQRGRKTEIDALNGAVVNLGRQYGVLTPINEVVVAMIKAKEAMRS